MDRRESLLALAAIGVSGRLGAQPARKVARVGVLFLASPASTSANINAMRSALQDLGYVDGRNIAFELRSADGRVERLPDLAAQLAALKVDVVVTGGGNISALAMAKASATIPIVMSTSFDAVQSGLIDSLARPGRNVTGLSAPTDFAIKQIELLRELIPPRSRVAILLRPNAHTVERRAQAKAIIQEFMQTTVDFIDIAEPEELAPALARVRSLKANAILVGPDPLFFQQREQVMAFARSARLPAIYPLRDFVEAGGLMSYSTKADEVYRSVARYIDKILKGAKPADLPVEEPREIELVINMKTAKALGLTIPQSVLLRATEVLQ